MIGYLLILGLGCWYAWRYSKTTIDPDWAMFNLGGFTDAIYGRDFVDCKTPLIHLWYMGIVAIVGKSVSKVKFAHHVLVSFPGLVLYWYTGSMAIGLAFVAMVNSGFLLAFHGNVGQIPAGMIALAIAANNPISGAIALAIALAFEPKLILSVILMAWFYGYAIPFAVIAGLVGLVALTIWRKWPVVMDWLIYQNLTIPKRMAEMRRDLVKKNMSNVMTWSSATGLLYILPLTLLGVYQRPVLEYWLPALALASITIAGMVLRQNHLIPFIGWVIMAGAPDIYLYGIVIVDLVASGFYLLDTWNIYYHGLSGVNNDAKMIGEFLKDKAGTLWVNGMHSAVYIYAQKKPHGGMCEQVEIRETAHERRESWREYVKKNPPEWAVASDNPGWDFNPKAGYRKIATTNYGSTIYQKV